MEESIMDGKRFKIKVADRVAEICTLYTKTKLFCKEYLTDECADFGIEMSAGDIESERIKSKAEDMREGHKVRIFSDEYLETLALLRKMATILPRYDTVLFHGSAVAKDGRGYIFAAPSGIGKTTHTRLWLKNIEGSYVVNGDKPFIRCGKEVTVCGSPWRGKENLGINTEVPLKAICMLERSDKNGIERISGTEVISALFSQVYRPDTKEAAAYTFDAVTKMCSLPVFKLRCNMDASAATVAYSMLSEV